MNFGALFATLGLAAVRSEVQATAQKIGRRLAFGFATGILVLTAVGFGIAAFTVWLAGEIGVIWALLAVAGILIVLAVIVQIIGASLDKRRPARSFRPPPPPPPRAAKVFDASDPDPIPPGSEIGAVAVVALVGFLLARQFFRRR